MYRLLSTFKADKSKSMHWAQYGCIHCAGLFKTIEKIRMQFKAKLITETEFRQIKFKDPKKG